MTLQEIEFSGAIKRRGRSVSTWQDVQHQYFLRMAIAYYYAHETDNMFYLHRYHQLKRAWNLVGALSFAIQYAGATEY